MYCNEDYYIPIEYFQFALFFGELLAFGLVLMIISNIVET